MPPAGGAWRCEPLKIPLAPAGHLAGVRVVRLRISGWRLREIFWDRIIILRERAVPFIVRITLLVAQRCNFLSLFVRFGRPLGRVSLVRALAVGLRRFSFFFIFFDPILSL